MEWYKCQTVGLRAFSLHVSNNNFSIILYLDDKKMIHDIIVCVATGILAAIIALPFWVLILLDWNRK